MTKTLTEQWHNLELDENKHYYWKLPKGNTMINDLWGMSDYQHIKDVDKVECLEQVPSYEEYKELVSKTEQLEKKLKIATKALKKYMTFCRHPAEEALKEMDGVK